MSGLVEYGDEIDVIAPVDVLKQIFKIPYSKARVSIAVQRVGQTLVLNPGCVFFFYFKRLIISLILAHQNSMFLEIFFKEKCFMLGTVFS